MGLLAQYGKDFKRIAASMPNKVRLSSLFFLNPAYVIFLQTTIQVGNFYTANLERYNLSTIAAQAPGRSPTPQEAKKDLLEQLDNATSASHERSFTICDVPPSHEQSFAVPPISATSRSHLMDLQSYPFTIPASSSASTLHLYS
jgi:polynucleotide 5'-kinase involved in rRNA processing